MAAYFFDIDGTIVNYHTNDFIKGAAEMLRKLSSRGHQINFMTMRGPQDAEKEWSMEKTKDLLDSIGIEYRVMYGVKSPRIFVDDRANSLIHHKKDQEWKTDLRIRL